MEEFLQQANSTIDKPGNLAGRALAPQEEYRNPASIFFGTFCGTITSYLDGEIVIELMDQTLSRAYKRSLTEAELGYSHHEFMKLIGKEEIRGRIHKEGDGIGFTLYYADDGGVGGIRLYLQLRDEGEPIKTALRLLTLKAMRKTTKLASESASKATAKLLGKLSLHFAS